MPAVSTDTVETDGVTLVEVRVGAERPHRVRLGIRSGGPVWPPRDSDTTARWHDEGVTLEVGPEPSGLGFATPGAPETVAVTLAGAEPLAEGLPDGIEAWVERVRRRVVTAERVAEADDLRSATAAVAALGGLAEVEQLAAGLARDRRLLSRLAVAPDELCERADAVELPTSALARVARAAGRN